MVQIFRDELSVVSTVADLRHVKCYFHKTFEKDSNLTRRFYLKNFLALYSF